MESNKSNQKGKGGPMINLTEDNYEAWSSICMDHLIDNDHLLWISAIPILKTTMNRNAIRKSIYH
jgi:hypothetical protein